MYQTAQFSTSSANDSVSIKPWVHCSIRERCPNKNILTLAKKVRPSSVLRSFAFKIFKKKL